MSNKAQALALLNDSKFAPDQICTIGAIFRRHLEEIQRAERVTALRAITLGLALWKVRLALPHGQWMPWQAEHLGVGGRQVNYYMRLALVFLLKSRATKTELRALPVDSVELTSTDALSRSLFSRLEKFVGECSLNELLVKHGIRGVTRDTDSASDEDTSGGPGEQMIFTEVCEHFYSIRQNLCRRETIMRYTPEQLDAAKRELDEIRSSFLALYAEARGTRK